ncbi:unnamed protein product [Paramecium sonneborni]|uniref:Uncharacterized protein n=1 Tax=Paramecium sonneborni TaxID=65129 RepID=A0A8S1PU41_9CILI|nr:unnamed protein product [Paramecium sonneborni]
MFKIFGRIEIQQIQTEAYYVTGRSKKQAQIKSLNNTFSNEVIIELLSEKLESYNLTIYVNSFVQYQNLTQIPVTNSINAQFYPNPIVCELKLYDNSVIKWCSDITCQQYLSEIPDLHINDIFVIEQIVTFYKRAVNFYLTKPTVWYHGDGLNMKAKIMSVNNENKGKVIIQIIAQIAWRKVMINVTSFLSSKQQDEESTLDISTSSDLIECIKYEGQESCAICTQECQVNGFAKDGCNYCSFSILKEFVFLVIMLFFII